MKILFDRLQEMAGQFIRLLPQISIALMIIAITIFLAKFSRHLVERLLRQMELRGTLVNLAETLISVMVWMLGLLISMSVVFPGITPANILAVFGLGSVAVGFAFKDIFENFLAGVLIMLRRQMRIGDVIQCGDLEGRIEVISLRDTHLRQLSNELVVVPNAFLFKNPVTVDTQMPLRRHEIGVGVSYGADLDAAQDVILRAANSCGTVSKERIVEVFARGFGESSIDFLVRWWCGSSPVDGLKSRDEIVRAVKRALDEAGIEIPFPHRTLLFPEPLAMAGSAPDPAPSLLDAPDPSVTAAEAVSRKVAPTAPRG